MTETEVEGVRLTSPDKILYPEQGITKGELAAYYQAIAPWMLPHVARRPTVRQLATEVAANIKSIEAGGGLLQEVDKAIGY